MKVNQMAPSHPFPRGRFEWILVLFFYFTQGSADAYLNGLLIF